MYLANLKLWNFRRFGSNQPFDIASPNLDINFQKGINLLIGENDSGKSAIIDAIKLVLKTYSSEWIKIEPEDFYLNTNRLRIECVFKGLTPEEAANFTEWLGWDEVLLTPILKVILDACISQGRIMPFDIKAGSDDEGHILTSEAKDKLKTTYLRPLRDAINELAPKRNSRLSQILFSHEAFRDKENHRLLTLSREFNSQLTAYFKGENAEGAPLQGVERMGKAIKDCIDGYLSKFNGKKSNFNINESNLKNILETLRLLFEDGYNLGLGSHNLLCISSELLHLQKAEWTGLKLGLVEEIEAHLHPQVQMQVIETLQTVADTHGIQLIFTTHSPNIGSKLNLKNIILCQEGCVYPLGDEHTHLASTDYTFLQRFLDITKANLFFAKGVILVEGWSEELLLPILAKKIGVNLTASGVSIINIGSTAFLRYAHIFKRRSGPDMKIRVAVVSDVDIKPLLAEETYKIQNPENPDEKIDVAYTSQEITQRIASQIRKKKSKYDGQVVRGFISPFWTLEYCIAKSTLLRQIFYKSVLEALKEQKEDEEVEALENYTNAIANVATYFNNWQAPDDEIAFAITNHILSGKTDLNIAKDKISKSIISQRFASNLEAIHLEEIQNEASLGYLFEAINYATGH